MVRFAAVGVGSTLAYFALYLLLRLGLGPQASNLVANLVTAVGNTATNRRLTFGVTGSKNLLRDHTGSGCCMRAVAPAVGRWRSSCWPSPASRPPPSGSSCCDA